MMRIGIVGCGRMGRERAMGCARFGAKVAFCVDHDKAAAAALAALHEGSTWLRDAAILPWKELDAIFVCTPPVSHARIVDFALANGRPVLVEKPLALSASETGILVSKLASESTINAVGYMNRYRRSVLKARELIASSKPIGIVCRWVSRRYAVPWWQDVGQSGGPLNEQATHIVDLCRFLLGDISSVKAAALTTPSQTSEERAAAVLQFENGSLGTLFYSCEAPDKNIGIDVYMNEGFVQLSGWNFELIANTVDGTTCPSEPDIFSIETAAFLEAAARGDQAIIRCSFEDAHRTQLTVDAMRASFGASTEVVAVR